MAIFNASNLTTSVLATQIAAVLANLRNALQSAADLYYWTSGITAAELEAIGFSAADANTILSACADANAMSVLYLTGLPPSSYPQPPSAYVYAESSAQIWEAK